MSRDRDKNYMNTLVDSLALRSSEYVRIPMGKVRGGIALIPQPQVRSQVSILPG